jgi:site-specific DNA-cytosine methylase
VVTGHGIATRHPSGTQRTHLNAIEDGSFELRDPWTVSSARLPTYDNVSLSRSYAGDAVNITPEEGAILQTFDPDFPFFGTRTKVWQTIGNAIPPLLAQHMIRQALGTDLT